MTNIRSSYTTKFRVKSHNLSTFHHVTCITYMRVTRMMIYNYMSKSLNTCLISYIVPHHPHVHNQRA